MKEYLENFRRDIQEYWDEQTVSPKFLPIDPTKPISAGQCAPTSYVLLQKLRQDFPDKNFTLAIGEVHKQGSVVIDYHVWVVEVCESPRDNRVLDVTADQSEVLLEVVYEPIRALAADGIAYVAYEQSPESRFIHDKALPRAELLQKRYKEGT